MLTHVDLLADLLTAPELWQTEGSGPGVDAVDDHRGHGEKQRAPERVVRVLQPHAVLLEEHLQGCLTFYVVYIRAFDSV